MKLTPLNLTLRENYFFTSAILCCHINTVKTNRCSDQISNLLSLVWNLDWCHFNPCIWGWQEVYWTIWSACWWKQYGILSKYNSIQVGLGIVGWYIQVSFQTRLFRQQGFSLCASKHCVLLHRTANMHTNLKMPSIFMLLFKLGCFCNQDLLCVLEGFSTLSQRKSLLAKHPS